MNKHEIKGVNSPRMREELDSTHTQSQDAPIGHAKDNLSRERLLGNQELLTRGAPSREPPGVPLATKQATPREIQQVVLTTVLSQRSITPVQPATDQVPPEQSGDTKKATLKKKIRNAWMSLMNPGIDPEFSHLPKGLSNRIDPNKDPLADKLRRLRQRKKRATPPPRKVNSKEQFPEPIRWEAPPARSSPPRSAPPVNSQMIFDDPGPAFDEYHNPLGGDHSVHYEEAWGREQRNQATQKELATRAASNRFLALRRQKHLRNSLIGQAPPLSRRYIAEEINRLAWKAKKKPKKEFDPSDVGLPRKGAPVFQWDRAFLPCKKGPSFDGSRGETTASFTSTASAASSEATKREDGQDDDSPPEYQAHTLQQEATATHTIDIPTESAEEKARTTQVLVPITLSHEAARELPLRDSHQSEFPRRDSHQSARELPLCDSHQSARELPLSDSHQSARELPLSDSHQSARELPLRDSHQSTRELPLRDSHQHERELSFRYSPRSAALLAEHNSDSSYGEKSDSDSDHFITRINTMGKDSEDHAQAYRRELKTLLDKRTPDRNNRQNSVVSAQVHPLNLETERPRAMIGPFDNALEQVDMGEIKAQQLVAAKTKEQAVPLVAIKEPVSLLPKPLSSGDSAQSSAGSPVPSPSFVSLTSDYRQHRRHKAQHWIPQISSPTQGSANTDSSDRDPRWPLAINTGIARGARSCQLSSGSITQGYKDDEELEHLRSEHIASSAQALVGRGVELASISNQSSHPSRGMQSPHDSSDRSRIPRVCSSTRPILQPGHLSGRRQQDRLYDQDVPVQRSMKLPRRKIDGNDPLLAQDGPYPRLHGYKPRSVEDLTRPSGQRETITRLPAVQERPGVQNKQRESHEDKKPPFMGNSLELPSSAQRFGFSSRVYSGPQGDQSFVGESRGILISEQIRQEKEAQQQQGDNVHGGNIRWHPPRLFCPPRPLPLPPPRPQRPEGFRYDRPDAS